jgi:hypothetical protein
LLFNQLFLPLLAQPLLSYALLLLLPLLLRSLLLLSTLLFLPTLLRCILLTTELPVAILPLRLFGGSLLLLAHLSLTILARAL